MTEDRKDTQTTQEHAEENRETRRQRLMDSATKRTNDLLKSGATYSGGTKVPPMLYLLSRKDGKPNVDLVDVSAYMVNEERKELFSALAPTLVQEADAKVVLLVTEAWALASDAPEWERKAVVAGERNVSDSTYRRTILSVLLQVEGERNEMSIYPFDEKRGRFDSEAFMTSVGKEMDVRSRWDFFTPTIEDLLESCDVDGPEDGTLRGI